NAKFFHTSGITQAISASSCDSVFAAIECANRAGVKVAYDANLRLRLWSLPRARATICATMALCDVFLVSIDEAQTLCGLSDPDQI
ncbi:PfkB family carbohydrate kinase, partial [Klebsiella pneumoniae]|nr:PfkB family carbohydrate kinase [Klebsiella pneumoniae]